MLWSQHFQSFEVQLNKSKFEQWFKSLNFYSKYTDGILLLLLLWFLFIYLCNIRLKIFYEVMKITYIHYTKNMKCTHEELKKCLECSYKFIILKFIWTIYHAFSPFKKDIISIRKMNKYSTIWNCRVIPLIPEFRSSKLYNLDNKQWFKILNFYHNSRYID